MVKKLLIALPLVLALSVAIMFLPAKQMDIEGIGRLSLETKITLSVGSEVAYAAPDLITNSPTADSGGWTNPASAYADGGGYASVMSGTPPASHTYSGYGFDLTGNQINQVRVRYDAWCAGTGGATNQQRIPTGDPPFGGARGTWTTTPSSPSTRYDKVDETPPANDADYITGVSTGYGGYGYCLFTFSPFSVPAGATITDLTIYYRAMDVPPPPTNRNNNIRAAIYLGGFTVYYTTDPGFDPGSSFTTYSYAYTTNPATGAAWTVDQINGVGANSLQRFGVASNDLNPDVDVSMVYAQVNYTSAVYDEQIRVDVSWDGGTSWSSQQITTLSGAEASYWYDVTSATSWTPDKLNDTNFRVRVDAYTQGDASEVRLDWIPVEVDYGVPSGWLCEFANRVRLTVDHNDVDTPLTDFPVLLYLSTSSGRNNTDVSFIFDELQSDANRYKIAVTTDDGVTQCYVEIEKWNDANEQAWLWVKVPAISDSSDTALYLYYDSTSADNTTYVGDTDSTPAENVWDGNFALVQHLGENTDVHDSTANNNDETNPPPPPPSGDPDPGYVRASYTDSGNMDGGYSFSNGSRLQMDHSDSLDITEAVTLEAFVYLNDRTDGKFIAKDDPFPGGAGCYNLHQEGNNLEFMLDFGGWYTASYGTYNTGEWLYVAGTYDRQTMRLYLNGSQVATNPQTSSITSDSNIALALGNRAYDVDTYYDLNGMLDEVRISDTTRSAAWIGASRESGIDDLIAFGNEETITEDIVNTPPSKDFGSVAENSSYWSNDSAPDWADGLDDGECYFMVTNNSTCPVDIEIRATDFTGGVGWDLATSPGENIVTLKAGRSGDAAEGNMVTLTNADQDFISSLGASASKKWEIKLETGTFTDGVQKTSTITLTATFA
jgi:hypothetical protein